MAFIGATSQASIVSGSTGRGMRCPVRDSGDWADRPYEMPRQTLHWWMARYRPEGFRSRDDLQALFELVAVSRSIIRRPRT